jgi:type 2 lantibiotic biosynthesis protein LanM
MGNHASLSNDEQRAIAWQGQTLFERIETYEQSDGSSFDIDSGEADEVDDFFTEWDEIIGDGSQETRQKRLADADISERICRLCLQTETWPNDVALPEWVHELNDLIEYVARTNTDMGATDKQFPFVDVLAPLVAYGQDQLLAQTDLPRFSQQARDSAKTWLLRRLTAISVEALHIEFSTFRMLREPSLLDSDGAADHSSSTTLYTDFVADMQTGEGLRSLCRAYPVLARLIVTTIRQWTAAILEFHQRLDQAWDEIRTTFAASDDITTIADLTVLTDDRHGDGRAVIRVVLSPASGVVYKPRDITTEETYGTLVETLSARENCELTTPVTLAKQDHGWVEWIASTDCTTTDEVRQYYTRTGMLLGIAYMTYLNDCHFENVIANGPHPVIVDTETIVHPVINSDEGVSVVEHETLDSVMWTGLLPRALDAPTGDSEVNISGLQVPRLHDNEDLSSPKWWDNMNSDTMTVATRDTSSRQLDNAYNVPRLNGTVETPDAYVDEIKQGFERSASHLRDHPELLAPLGEIDTRILFGQTHTYTSILAAITAPECLRSGATLTLRLEHLIADRSFDGDYRETRQQIYQAERTAIKRLDVPRFVVAADEIYFDGAYIGETTGRPGWDRVADKQQSVSDEELAKQRDYIQIACVSETSPAVAGHTTHAPRTHEEPATETLASRVEHHLTSIEDHIRQQATVDREGATSWILREYSNNRCLEIRKSDNGIYTGRAGIAIFFALLHHVSSRATSRQMALNALAPLRKQVHTDGLSATNLGNSTGIGSQIYALSKVGQLLEQPQIVDDAEQVATQLTDARLHTETEFDVMNGCAGALLSLVELYTYRPQDWLLRKAIACGDHLLANRCTTETDYRAWPSSLGPQPLTGFSHGAAGIAYALYRLFDACGEPRFKRAGKEGLRYERTTYSSEQQNWADLRGESPTYLDAWCYGRSGIGLSRLGIAAIDETPFVRDDLTTALEQTPSTSTGFPDQLCCGNAGRIDCLLRAAEYTNTSAYLEKANRLLRTLLQRAEANQCFAIPGHTRRLYNPSLFMGTAGIGYTLLRHQYRTDVPCLLLWE